MFVCCECCVLSGRGLCDNPITRPEESYRLWCVVVCDLENLVNEEAMTRVGSQPHRERKNLNYILVCKIFKIRAYFSELCYHTTFKLPAVVSLPPLDFALP
jgi:hypothetical protein